ncbi:glucose-dependent insulinotropic receptor [Chiloscyllium plagiosum]|uniref:glucose-dependent insulinotropic receptor n=1 Tax=Chiloscyllium plagiosum TaxID=36176 RepID=UPI001CB83165|nr:glucose-dependent insulinotropic receptor [Chiloscyllium plagiosum]
MDVNHFGSIVTVLSLLIIVSNAVVVVVLVLMILKNRSASLCFVLNLAVADMLVGFTCFGTAVIVLTRQDFTASRELCMLRISLIISPSAASILTMVSVAFDRFLAIKLPLQYCRLMLDKMVALIIVCLWTVALIIGFLPVIIRQLQPKEYNGTCTLFSIINPKYIIIVFCSCFLPASLIFVYFYSVILKIAYSHTRQILESERISAVSSPAPPPRCHIRDVKAVRIIGILVGCFMVAWTPFFIATSVQACCTKCQLYTTIEDYLWLLSLCNSLLNPLIYSYWQKDVRKKVLQLCCVAKPRISPTRCVTRWETIKTQNPGAERGTEGELPVSCAAIGTVSYCTTNTPNGT